MFQNILIVCLGNICRSPTAEQLLQKKLPRHQISSAGLRALTGNGADFQAVKTALEHGVIVARHTACQLTAEMCERADLILVVEPEQINMVADTHPSARNKTILFAQWLPKGTVPDPFNQGSEIFEAVYLQLEEVAQAWARKLNANARGRLKPRNTVKPTSFTESFTP